MMAETTCLSAWAYHVSKEGHAEAIGLDALICQHVVHQHQFAVAEPDFPALSLLCWRVVGPSCQSEEEIVCDELLILIPDLPVLANKGNVGYVTENTQAVLSRKPEHDLLHLTTDYNKRNSYKNILPNLSFQA